MASCSPSCARTPVDCRTSRSRWSLPCTDVSADTRGGIGVNLRRSRMGYLVSSRVAPPMLSLGSGWAVRATDRARWRAAAPSSSRRDSGGSQGAAPSGQRWCWDPWWCTRRGCYSSGRPSQVRPTEPARSAPRCQHGEHLYRCFHGKSWSGVFPSGARHPRAIP
jgi:hypothetical protein